MNWDDFQARAGRAIPIQKLKPKRCWIGVLNHEKSPADDLEELDFVWMCGHGKISLQRVYETYQTRSGLSDSQFELKHGDIVADKSDLVKSFLSPSNDPVFFYVNIRVPTPSPIPLAVGTGNDSRHVPSIQAQITPPPVTPVSARPKYSTPFRSSTIRQSAGPKNTRRETASATERLAEDLLPKAPSPSVNIRTPLKRSSSKVSHESAIQQTGTRLISPSVLDSTRAHASVPFPPTSYDGPSVPLPSYRPFPGEHSDADNGVVSGRSSVGVEKEKLTGQTAVSVKEGSRSANPDHGRQSVKEERHDATPSFDSSIEGGNHIASPFQSPPRGSQPFNPEDVFNREPSPETNSQEKAKPTDRNIRTIIEKSTPETLEAGVNQSMKVLESMKQMFSHHATNEDAQAWIHAINKLMPQAARKRTVVGVVGNTGAGKSSVINAMLDEERLVPTNCMRACTAVVTEMSWNDERDPNSKYRGEIEFIDKVDWEKELHVLMKEFLTETGTVSKEVANPDSEAGIAWAKFHAVYPKIPRDALEDCTVLSLMSEKSVLDVLGTSKKIRSAQPERFYQELQKYVDSKEKVTKKDNSKDKEKKKKSFQMEYWPLIKVVKIYTKSPALETGAVIVDLPGVHDSNAARAAVAQGYMKQCTGLWIVAPINRAVDDKAAKNLLGESFKRQLKYDGGFSSVTFICSKTDDISITEAIDSLELNDEVADFEEEQRTYEEETKHVEDKIEDLKESQKVYKIAGREADDNIEVWEDLATELDDGKTVFPPAPKNNKRKKSGSSKESRKKRHASKDDSDDDFIVPDDENVSGSDEDTEDEDDDDDVQAPQLPLTEADIKEKLKGLRETKKNARREGQLIQRSIDDLKPKIREQREKIAEIKAKISHKCIAGRNEYAKTAIQQDFAAGIKELDQENAAEEDEDDFNPNEEMRDYEEVAKSLPVFCVSSRAYQQMCGRLRKDDAVPGFLTPEETEMPQLQAHCKKLTEAGRIQTCRTFLLNVCQLLTTFNLWASNDGTGVSMNDEEKRKQLKYLDRRLKELDDGLTKATNACVKEMRVEMKHQIFDKYPELITEAIQVAPNTSTHWGAHKEQGGLLWSTYKATVRRDGVYQSASAGHRDFNAELVDPIIKKLATGWERAFQHRLPKAFNTYIANSGRILHNFHEAVEERARQNGVGLANLSILKTQIYTYEQLFKDLNTVLITQMTELQREANRDFTPTIGNYMQTAYQMCTEERGKGSFKRMKEYMANHVERERHQMFHKATETVNGHLDQMCKSLERSMEEKADEIFMQMDKDYMQVLGGVQTNAAMMSREERELRADIMTLLRGVDAQFEPIANGEVGVPGALDDEEETQTEEPVVVEDGDASAFESASGIVHDEVDDTLMADNNKNEDDTTSAAESSHPKPHPAHSDLDDTSDKENRGLPTPASDSGMDEL